MDCPTCKTHGAYVGMSVVECPNERCQNYDQKQRQHQLAALEKAFEKLDNLSSLCHRPCLVVHSGVEWIVRGDKGPIMDGFDTEESAKAWAIGKGYSPLSCLVENRSA